LGSDLEISDGQAAASRFQWFGGLSWFFSHMISIMPQIIRTLFSEGVEETDNRSVQ
jgi:hypothetical protein